MQNLNWNETEARAKKMTVGQLQFAYQDCLDAAAAVGPEAFGKDESYYRDEASVYYKELTQRAEKPLSARAKKAVAVLKAGGYFSYRLETDSYTRREQFQTRLIDNTGAIVKGFGFKVHQELLNLGRLRTVATYKTSRWEERTTHQDVALVADEAAVHAYRAEFPNG